MMSLQSGIIERESAPATQQRPGAWQQEGWFPMRPDSSTRFPRVNLLRAHGTYHRYGYRHCRCPWCRAANAEYKRKFSGCQPRGQHPPKPDAPGHRINLLHTHGSPGGNLFRWHGCRCVCCRGAATEYHRHYMARHPEMSGLYRDYRAEYMRTYNPEHVEELRAYRKANPDRVRSWANNRRARMAGAGGSYTSRDVRAQYARQRGRCYWCGAKVGDTYHIDHVIPLSRGGGNDPSNLVISCPHCNTSKQSKMPHEFGYRLC